MKHEYHKPSKFEQMIEMAINQSEEWKCVDITTDKIIHFPKIVEITRNVCLTIELALKNKMAEDGCRKVICDNGTTCSINAAIHDAFYEILHEKDDKIY